MVDALRRAHRALKPRGLLFDARPDASRIPRVIARGRVRAHLRQSENADRRDAASDAAIARVKAAGLFRSIETGWIWYQNVVGDLRALDEYAEASSRYEGYRRGERAKLVPFRSGPFTLRRGIRFEVLQRL
ncbi:MAG: hypothetical protein ACRDGT_03995 [Candidatus Limnocylindria bacterium]